MDSREQPVSEILTEPVRSVSPETSTREVATILREESIGSVVVGNAAGIVTKTDVLAGIETGSLDEPVSELMTDPVVTVSKEADVQTAIDRMEEYELKRVVVEDDTDVVGIVSTTDLRQALATNLDSVIDMFARSGNAGSENTYECVSCGDRVTAERKPGTCTACDAPLRNIGMPRN